MITCTVALLQPRLLFQRQRRRARDSGAIIAPSDDNVETSVETSGAADHGWRWRAIGCLHAKLCEAALEPSVQTLAMVLEAHRNEGANQHIVRVIDELRATSGDVALVLAPRLLTALALAPAPVCAPTLASDRAQWIQMAADLAARSDRDRYRHGAVLVAADGKLLSSGFNHNYSTSANKHKVMHAEVHALVALRGRWASAVGATMYVVELNSTGLCFDDAQPCQQCTKALIKVGVARAVFTSASKAISDQAFRHNPAIDAEALALALGGTSLHVT